MLFHEFRKENDRIIVMIHGLCMNWRIAARSGIGVLNTLQE